jgi:glycosyltransferase involved in cell wall biosynthesis
VLQSAHAFLLSSLSEGISNAALEAMACGLPVVTTDCGGMREAVTDSVHGFVVPRRNPDAMAAALSRLIGNSPLRSSIGSQARERVLRDFTLNHQVDAFVRLYRSLLSSPVAA